MNVIQVIILLVGAVLFTVSFLLPDRKTEVARDTEKDEEFIRETILKEIEGVRGQLDEAAEDAVAHTKDTTERYLDRITNEKMNAISEYSDTVMEQIHKNHEETVFLYDMLNNKHAQIKNTAAEINNIIRSAKEQPVVATPVTEIKAEKVEKEVTEDVKDIPKEKTFESLTVETVEVPKQEPEVKPAPKRKSMNKKTASPTKKTSSVEMVFATDHAEANNNDKILALHKEGKSNIAIARELGLGIGEVKLVIDLFEGIG